MTATDQQHQQSPPDSTPAPEETPVYGTGRGGVAPGVFYPALVIIGLAVLLSIAFPGATGDVLSWTQDHIVAGFGWYYVLIVAGFIAFALWMGLSRFGDIKLGKDEDEPEFSIFAWFAMLFAAGMGIGLVFWGTAEPLTFFADPKPGVSGSKVELAQSAMAQTFLHWGLHAWAIYVVVGLALAYAIHRKGRPVSMRYALEPLLGDRVHGWVGNAIDTIAVVGTVFGIATSLGLGVKQISAGLVHLEIMDDASDTLMVVLIVIITAFATLSVVSGVGKGIKWLSNTNLMLAGVFLLAVLLLGPTLYLLRNFVESVGIYLQQVVPLTFSTASFQGGKSLEWEGAWTVFYWGWWISWSPFVGVFIARISRGRTIREFVAGVLLVPTVVTFLWFTVLGGSAIMRQMQQHDLVPANKEILSENVLFDFLGHLPMSSILSVMAILLVTIFFVTSSDSGSLVVDMLCSGGNPDPPTWSRILWASLEGAVAMALLLAGGLNALQTGAIITALPFSLVMIGICIATYRALSDEHRLLVRADRRAAREELARSVGENVTSELTEHYDDHLAPPVEQHVLSLLGPEREPEPDDRS